jgi:hypothetical protein
MALHQSITDIKLGVTGPQAAGDNANIYFLRLKQYYISTGFHNTDRLVRSLGTLASFDQQWEALPSVRNFTNAGQVGVTSMASQILTIRCSSLVRHKQDHVFCRQLESGALNPE